MIFSDYLELLKDFEVEEDEECLGIRLGWYNLFMWKCSPEDATVYDDIPDTLKKTWHDGDIIITEPETSEWDYEFFGEQRPERPPVGRRKVDKIALEVLEKIVR